MRKHLLSLVAIVGILAPAISTPGVGERRGPLRERPNIILFITDGLRRGSVTKDGAPELWSIRENGVDFENSHALFPTLTTSNASAFATGHGLGDTGDFGNTIWIGRRSKGGTGSPTPFLEDDTVLGDLQNIQGYMPLETLVGAAHKAGFNTAVIGKLGPALIQAIRAVPSNPCASEVVLIDDSTGMIDGSSGKPKGVPLSDCSLRQLQKGGFLPAAPDRSNGMPCTQADNRFDGLDEDPCTRKDNGGKHVDKMPVPGTLAANVKQEVYFRDVTINVLLDSFYDDYFKHDKPFLIVFWSRDPDGTQHYQGDSFDSLVPGINGPTSDAGVKNADAVLKTIRKALHNYQVGVLTTLEDFTDLIVVADHGFSTISKTAIDPDGATVTSYSTNPPHPYSDVGKAHLPPGFLAMDLANYLNDIQPSASWHLFDPDAKCGSDHYMPVNPKDFTDCFELHSSKGNGLIGGTGLIADGDTSANLIVAANGGTDLIYAPRSDSGLIEKVAHFLSESNYVDGFFVNDDLYKNIPGALSLNDIGMKGIAGADGNPLPVPAVVVNFKSFSRIKCSQQTQGECGLQTQVEIADSTLQQGQGMHGSFSRADTWNNMAAIGPDFRSGFVDNYPVSNADVAVTVAYLLGLRQLPSPGNPPQRDLLGRVMDEALVHPKRHEGGQDFRTGLLKVACIPAFNSKRTVVEYQSFAGHEYYDRAYLTTDVNPPNKTCPNPPAE